MERGRDPATSNRHRRPVTGVRTRRKPSGITFSDLLSLCGRQDNALGHHAITHEVPSAIRSLRASATIKALSFWNATKRQANWIMPRRPEHPVELIEGLRAAFVPTAVGLASGHMASGHPYSSTHVPARDSTSIRAQNSPSQTQAVTRPPCRRPQRHSGEARNGPAMKVCRRAQRTTLLLNDTQVRELVRWLLTLARLGRWLRHAGEEHDASEMIRKTTEAWELSRNLASIRA